MPFLKLQTNTSIENPKKLATDLSSLVASSLGKPESYVMVSIERNENMAFAGKTDDLVYMELKSIGLKEDQTKELSKVLCDQVSQEVGAPKERIYIEFAAAPRAMWGWNGSTF